MSPITLPLALAPGSWFAPAPAGPIGPVAIEPAAQVPTRGPSAEAPKEPFKVFRSDGTNDPIDRHGDGWQADEAT